MRIPFEHIDIEYVSEGMEGGQSIIVKLFKMMFLIIFGHAWTQYVCVVCVVCVTTGIPRKRRLDYCRM